MTRRPRSTPLPTLSAPAQRAHAVALCARSRRGARGRRRRRHLPRRRHRCAPAAAPRRRAAPTAHGAAPACGTCRAAARSSYTGHPVSLDFQGADLRAVLRTFAEISGLNIVIDPSVQGSVDVVAARRAVGPGARHHPARQQARLLVDGTIVRVAPLTVLADEEKQRRKLAEAQALSGELRVLTRTLSYAKAADLKPPAPQERALAARHVEVDPRTNTLIITRPRRRHSTPRRA